jgi:hypothetical protein
MKSYARLLPALYHDLIGQLTFPRTHLSAAPVSNISVRLFNVHYNPKKYSAFCLAK